MTDISVGLGNKLFNNKQRVPMTRFFDNIIQIAGVLKQFCHSGGNKCARIFTHAYTHLNSWYEILIHLASQRRWWFLHILAVNMKWCHLLILILCTHTISGLVLNITETLKCWTLAIHGKYCASKGQYYLFMLNVKWCCALFGYYVYGCV